MVAGKADNADVGWVKAQVIPAPLWYNVVKIVRPWLVDGDTAYLAEVRAVSPYLRE
jgi:hypothetical protein